MGNTSVLSSNSHYNKLQKPSGAKSEEDHFNRGANDLTRHPSLCFDDGNLAIVTEQSYFLIHRGLLCRQSPKIQSLVESLPVRDFATVEGRPILQLEEATEDVSLLLYALYDGM